MDIKELFSTRDVLKALEISRNDLNTIMRPVRSNGTLLPPVFTPDVQSKLINAWVFTQNDISRLKRYFIALKEYKAARNKLRKTQNES